MIADQDITQTLWVSPLGPMRLATTPVGLAGAWFDTDRHGPDPQRVRQWKEMADQPLLAAAIEQLQAYFERQRRAFDLPLDLRLGTPFQQQAWRALLTIGPGETISYGELARRMGRPQAARAAGAAIGRNPLSIIVPCHRVVGSNGSLTGYAGGLDRKLALLRLEGAWI
ncbi:MAG: methylated-DNA--[protein]-cysteine S-methyltransferase [Burkholderiales bacterium]|nr:MAG: methylated-DNA--[protein]-cysteine S-methyltransferase [Burkholderiales bacterium]